MSHTKQSTQQQIGDQQVALTYLLGLDWTIPQHWQQVRNQEATLKELRKAAATGALGSIIETTAVLRTRLAVAEARARDLQYQSRSFQVLPEYRRIEVEATALSRRLRDLADENTLDRELIAQLEQALSGEANPGFGDLETLYAEVGVLLPEVVLKRFEDVRAFHESIIQNRRLYLDGELAAARQRVTARGSEMTRLQEDLAQTMVLLRSHGALDQFVYLQAELARAEADVDLTRKRFRAAEQLESQKTELDLERAQLVRRLQQDYQEQSQVLRQAIAKFEELSQGLFEEAGSLTISISPNGPQFDIQIHGAASKGINNMQIFCFDLMLMELGEERGIGPGFLVHDSHLFDGVDERQIASALAMGAERAHAYGYQYIVTMNSDNFPATLLGADFIKKHSLPIFLSDVTETGGLFGFRFN